MKNQAIIIYLLTAQGIYSFQPVDINQANAEQMALLPGVGQKLAQDIVAFRSKHGSFATKEALLTVPGLSAKKMAAITNHINLSTPKKSVKLAVEEEVTMSIKAPPPLNLLEPVVIKAHGLSSDLDQSIGYRVRRYAWLPKLSTGIDFDNDHMVAEKKGDAHRDSLMKRGSHNVGFLVRLTFDLDKLIYNSDELEVLKMQLKRSEAREELIKVLHSHYFAYQELYEMAKKPMPKTLAKDIQQKIDKTVATLESLSTGGFSMLQAIE